jgi:hypothetical protein
MVEDELFLSSMYSALARPMTGEGSAMISLITTVYRSICARHLLPIVNPNKIIHLHFIQQKYFQSQGLKR